MLCRIAVKNHVCFFQINYANKLITMFYTQDHTVVENGDSNSIKYSTSTVTVENHNTHRHFRKLQKSPSYE